jgi:hypothetical protein
MTDKPNVLTLGPMARRLRVPVQWLRKQAEAGEVPCIRDGEVFLFAPDAVEAALFKRAAEWPADRQGVPNAD